MPGLIVTAIRLFSVVFEQDIDVVRLRKVTDLLPAYSEERLISGERVYLMIRDTLTMSTSDVNVSPYRWVRFVLFQPIYPNIIS